MQQKTVRVKDVIVALEAMPTVTVVVVYAPKRGAVRSADDAAVALDVEVLLVAEYGVATQLSRLVGHQHVQLVRHLVQQHLPVQIALA